MRTRTADELKTILDQVRRRIEQLYGNRLHGLYLFGSYARGDAVGSSDLDLLLVLDRIDSYWDEIKRTSHMRSGLSLEHDLSVSLVYVSEGEWLAEVTPFLRTVRKEAKAA